MVDFIDFFREKAKMEWIEVFCHTFWDFCHAFVRTAWLEGNLWSSTTWRTKLASQWLSTCGRARQKRMEGAVHFFWRVRGVGLESCGIILPEERMEDHA